MKKIKTIYCDFDGTITQKDAVNTFFEQFADPKWLEYEQLWVEGKISSMENAIKQVALIRPMAQDIFDDYVNNIEIDETFLDFVKFLQKQEIKLVIVSDGFDLFITKVLERYNLTGIKVFANHFTYENGKFSIDFPFHNDKCDIGAGMCKCQKVEEKEFCYIGDGTSDLCIAQKANLLFATKNLKKYCCKNNIKYYPFNSFRDIIKKLEEIIEADFYEKN